MEVCMVIGCSKECEFDALYCRKHYIRYCLYGDPYFTTTVGHPYNEKVERNQMCLQLHEKGYTLAIIARTFGITRQRAHQIIKREKEKK